MVEMNSAAFSAAEEVVRMASLELQRERRKRSARNPVRNNFGANHSECAEVRVTLTEARDHLG